jgi:hypothetical protein
VSGSTMSLRRASPVSLLRGGLWDITKLLGPTTWTYYYLYVILEGQAAHE